MFVALIAVSAVVADWGTRTVAALHHGMTSVDTLWYHMPYAARFVQQSSVTPLHYFDSDPVTVFFPATSELFHSLGILFLGNDFLSPLINFGWFGVALLAGWCIGRPFNMAPMTLTGVAVVLVTPGFVGTQPGGAYDDIVGLALVLACCALLVASAARGRTNEMAGLRVAALAAGLALGTKFTFIAPIAAFTIGVWLIARRGRRVSIGIQWLALVAITGGFWYLRNLVAVGNPLPTLRLALGPLSLPSTHVNSTTSTVAHFLMNGEAWRTYFLPGLRLSFGPAWWALLGLALVGLVLGASAGGSGIIRLIACSGIATAAIFLVTPQYLTILGAPVFFVDNVRYADPAVALGLVVLPLVPALRAQRAKWVLGAYGAIILATQFDGSIWPINVLAQRFTSPVGGIDSLIGLLLGFATLGTALVVLALRRTGRGGRPAGAIVLATLILVASGFALEQFYLRNRYLHASSGILLSWARQISNARIAVAGPLTQLQYGLYGGDLTNYVQYVAQSEPHDGRGLITTCAHWRQALDRGRFQYVVTSNGIVSERQRAFDPPQNFTLWTGTDPAATLIRREVLSIPPSQQINGYVGLSLFRIDGRLSPSQCGPAGTGVSASMSH